MPDFDRTHDSLESFSMFDSSVLKPWLIRILTNPVLLACFCLFFGFTATFSANARKIGNEATVANMLLPVAILRGDGPYLDRWKDDLSDEKKRLPDFLKEHRGHIVTGSSLVTPMFVLPFYWPHVVVLDRFKPEWDRPIINTFAFFNLVEKNTAAFLGALTSVVLYLLLRRVQLQAIALPVVMSATLGSSLWSIASQALWDQTLAVIVLSLLLLILVDGKGRRLQLIFGGILTTLLVAIRPIDICFATPIALWVWRNHRSRQARLLYLTPLFVSLSLLVAVSLYIQGMPFAGWYTHHFVIGNGIFDTVHNYLESMLGHLISPIHGILVYTPWIGVAMLSLPFTWRRMREQSLVTSTVTGLFPFFLLMSLEPFWVYGPCFGPRAWTDAVPIFVLMLAYGIDMALARSTPALCYFLLAVSVSVGIQVIGAFFYPSSWFHDPVPADSRPERYWDLTDTEISRCLSEGIHKPQAFVTLWRRFTPEGPPLPQ